MDTIELDGLTRHYLLHLPPAPDGRPLIIALHPLASNPKLMEAMTGLSVLADVHHFIVVYPEGFASNEGGPRSWNASFCCRDSQSRDVDDLGFLSAMIDSLRSRYDVPHVLVTGFSNGGMLAHYTGLALADQVDAIAPVGATIGAPLTTIQPSRAIPVMMVHGTEDRLVPFDRRSDDRFLPGARTAEHWARLNGCSLTPDITRSGGVSVMRYEGCAINADVSVFLVGGAGHVWPGGHARLRGEVDPGTFNASMAILDFFRSRYP